MNVRRQQARRLMLTVLASLCTMVGGLTLWSAPASAARGHVFSGSFGGEGSGNGQLKEPSGVAVDEETGDVYVVDAGNNRVEIFSAAGTFEGQFDGSGAFEVKGKAEAGTAAPTGRFSSPESIAVDNDPSSPSFGDVYVADTGHNVIDKFSATGAYLSQLTEGSGGAPFGRIYGIAVDPGGALWVYQESNEVDSFNGAVANELLSSRQSNAFSTRPGFAVDSNDNMYVKTFFTGIEKLNSSGEVLAAEFNPLLPNPDSEEFPSGVAVDLSSNEVYIDDADGEGSVGRFTAAGSFIEKFGSQQLVKGRGLAVDSRTGAVYVADAGADAVDIFLPEPPAAPRVAGESVSNVRSGSATFSGRINPRGPTAEYRFEYGPTAAYGNSAPVPDGIAGSGFEVQEVSMHVQGLVPGTDYHFRLVAHNELGSAYGEDLTLSTQPLGGESRLPDGRLWEMVSPPQKEGALLGWIVEGIVQASANGDAFTDWTFFEPMEEKAAGAYGFVTANFFGRGPDGWTAKSIAPPHSAAGRPPVGNGQEYRIFSEDLSRGILQPFGPVTPLVPEVTESTPYLRTDYLNGNSGELCVSGCFQPLVSAANVPAGTKYGGEPNGKCEGIFCGPHVLGGSPDLSHVVLNSSAALTATPLEEHQGLYEWSAGKLTLVNLLPQGETNETGGSVANVSTGGFNQVSRHMVSNDGSRVIWMGGPTRFGTHLYLHDMSNGYTARVDAPNTGAPGGGEEREPQYMTASGDASRIFFLDTERLTEDSTAAEQDLYEYNLNAPAGGRLTDLTVDRNLGESAGVSMVTGASEDGSYVYFTANGALAPGAGPGKCGGNAPKPGETKVCNLYVRHNGTTTFIAGLSAEDFPDWTTTLSGLPARVSPNGHWLAFMSSRKLTGYDNTDAVSGHPDEEVYLYDASADRLICASCNPTGARPAGVRYNSEQLVAADRVFDNGTWVASNVPPWTRFNLGESRYQSRYLSNSGRLFFDSHDALVPQDVNGTQDVYEYEPPGVGDCSPSKTTFSERSGGCVALVSSGTSNEESVFLDASETGGDVFFLTSARLAPQDFDNAFDIYDAHECSAQSPCIAPAPVPPPPCSTGDSCKSAPSPQPEIFGSPASATFSGAGNVSLQAPTPAVKQPALTRAQRLARALRACHKKKGRRRAACERQARARYAVKQSRKANATKRGRG